MHAYKCYIKKGKHTPYALAEPKEPSTSITLGVNRTAHIISTDHPSSELFKAVKHRKNLALSYPDEEEN